MVAPAFDAPRQPDGNVVFMTTRFERSGYNWRLSLSHIVFWMPFLIRLHRRRGQHGGEQRFDGWAQTLLVTNGLSLVIDYLDPERYVLGDCL